MTDTATANHTVPYNPAAVGAAIDDITAGLERVMAGFANLKLLLVPEADADSMKFDPMDPANKYEVGGLEKLTKRGVEICYRLFDAGKTRYAVASLMKISFGAATHRYKAWEKAGGLNRAKQPLE
jgi:hypothetical protein